MNKSLQLILLGVIFLGSLGIYFLRHMSKPDKFHFVLEAESADSVALPFEVGKDADASGGQYLIIKKGSMAQFRQPGRVAYRIPDGPAQSLHIWIRAKSENPCLNSFYMAVDGKRRMMVGNTDSANVWVWASNFDVQVSAGEHTVEILAREDLCLLDKIILTNDISYRPDI